MNIFVFTKYAEKILRGQNASTQERILWKLNTLKNHPNLEAVLKKLSHFEPATHRLRVGSFRIILALQTSSPREKEWWILDLGDRKDVYR